MWLLLSKRGYLKVDSKALFTPERPFSRREKFRPLAPVHTCREKIMQNQTTVFIYACTCDRWSFGCRPVSLYMQLQDSLHSNERLEFNRKNGWQHPTEILGDPRFESHVKVNASICSQQWAFYKASPVAPTMEGNERSDCISQKWFRIGVRNWHWMGWQFNMHSAQTKAASCAVVLDPTTKVS